MFGPQADARELTEQDRTFLRALYQLPLDRTARRHRGTLVGEIVSAQTQD